MKELGNKSRYLAKLLRHKPEDLIMSKDGYVTVESVLKKLSISKDDLDWIVENNDKKRFAYNDASDKIRASQGHNNSLDIEITMRISPRIDMLYHGTAKRNLDSIMKTGLLPQNRKHVHMSDNMLTAVKVGTRHDKDIVVLKIDSGRMRGDGINIYISDNGVYLTDSVDPKYIST